MADTPPLPEVSNGLHQHPISPLPSTPLSPPPGFLLSHSPSMRLSTSPASSPRIVASPPTRMQSIHPETGSLLLAAGSQLGADFLELTSDDGSEWEDDDGTHNFNDVEGARISASAATFESARSDDWEEERGRKRQSQHLTALPPFNRLPAHEHFSEEFTLPARRPPSQARHMSLKRYSRVNVVHNHGSPRSSIISNTSSDVVPRPLNVSHTVSQNNEEPSNRPSNDTRRHYQESTSETESIRLNAFLHAHYATLQAIDSRSKSPPAPHFSFPDTSKQRSLSEPRHIRLIAPIQTGVDPDRPPHLPAHFIRTPYPFSPRKEFPPPKTRPRKTDLHITPLDPPPSKGIHILGIAPPTDYDPRPRLERNLSAQGLVRASPTTKHERYDSTRSTNSTRESTLWLSLRRTTRHLAPRLEPLTIPSSTASPHPSPPFKPSLRRPPAADYDDTHFARDMRAAYARLAGPWALRVLSARKLRYIRLARVGAWSGAAGGDDGAAVGALLAVGRGLATLESPCAPFTERALLELYRAPREGGARYTWVHWGRRVAASRGSRRASRAGTLAEGLAEEGDASLGVTTVQFVHAFAPFKMLTVLVVMLAFAVAAAVVYVFVGNSVWRGDAARERAEKVTPGMLVGGLVGAVEGVVFVAWVGGSWMWL